MASEKQKEAKRRYEAKKKRITVDFYPPELALYEHLQKQSQKQTYIKNLIRADIQKNQ